MFVLIGIVLMSSSLSAGTNCLDRLSGKSQNPRFDLKQDSNAEGDSFSCDVGVRASEAMAILEDFRHGFLYDNLPRLERSIHFPLQVTVAAEGSEDRVVMINTAAEWLKFKVNHFDKYERALIACANLANVRIHKKWGGFAIGTGRVWFFNSANHGLRVGQINVAPMSAELFRSSCVVDGQDK